MRFAYTESPRRRCREETDLEKSSNKEQKYDQELGITFGNRAAPCWRVLKNADFLSLYFSTAVGS